MTGRAPLRMAVVALLSVAASACMPPNPAPVSPESLPPVIGSAQVASARESLTDLPPAGQPHPAGYSRERFGKPWADVDHNGCDTRNDILARDLADDRRKHGCVVTSGVLRDPYTGGTVRFRRGADSGDVQIDHLYPLHRAWEFGARKWSQARRIAFANDRGELLAVSGRANAQKGDSGPAEWQPPWRAYRCAYAVDYIDIARIYALPVTTADRRALRRMLDTCKSDGHADGAA
jgi:hypothetical protein